MMDPRPPIPDVRVQSEPLYILGFPLVVSVEISNPLDDTWYASLPETDLLSVPRSLGIALDPLEDGQRFRRVPQPSEHEATVELGPQSSRWRLLDLSNLGVALEPGAYQLTVSFPIGGTMARSTPTRVQLIAPTDDERELRNDLLSRLRGFEARNGCWRSYLEQRVDDAALRIGTSRTQALAALAPYQLVQRAWHGSQSLSEFDPTLSELPWNSVVWPPEFSLWRAEILRAAESSLATAAIDESARRWPGIRDRAALLRDGFGFLAMGRRT